MTGKHGKEHNGANPSSELAGRLDRLKHRTDSIDLEVRAATLRRVEQTGPLAWLRSRSTRQRHAALLALAGVLSIGVLLAVRRADLATYPLSRLLTALTLLAVSGALAAHVALRPLHLPSPRRLTRRLALTATVVVVLLLALLPDAYTGAHLHLQVTDRTWVAAGKCLLFGFLTGLPLLALMWLLSSTALGATWRMALAALAAAAAGNFTLQLHCPITEPLHLLLGHAGVLLPFALLSLLHPTRH